MGKTVALLVAAGSGSRVGDGPPKQYRRLGWQSVLAHAIDGLEHPRIDAIQVVIAPGQEAAFADAIGGRALPSPIIGGATRQESVRNGLEALARSGAADIVLIHDAARPFLPAEVIDRLLAAVADHAGAVPVLPVSDTLACASDQLGDAVSRDGLVRVQTPQAFRFDAILAAHRGWSGPTTSSDDAQIARSAGLEIVCVPGSKDLEKITFEEDLIEAERRLSAGMISRAGLGFDVHAFGPGDHLWLGGVRTTHERGLVGHSDADVALHAITDALLGAASEGDIGDHFPPSDPQWRGAASARFVEHARALIERRGGIIDHVDLTIICEAPRIGPHKAAMRQTIAALLGLPEARISIKATTTERLGFTGRGEGIAAQAVATVRMTDDQLLFRHQDVIKSE
jgi:2-C-methyl-D-erythritol 4-phosphate cytidylyltransferase/2-C-methyl-D-erythritol 2,4-cyclodiphosphate synthase